MPFLNDHSEAMRYLSETSPAGSLAVMCMTPEARYLKTAIYTMVLSVQTGLSCTVDHKIPPCYLDEIIEYFRKDLTNEALARIYYKDSKFLVDFPEIISVDKVHIKTKSFEPEKGLVVCEIHSHNTMPAFWSATDNEDEVYPILYGVIGNLNRETPSMRFRAVLNGDTTILDTDDVFSVDVDKNLVSQYMYCIDYIGQALNKGSLKQAKELMSSLNILRKKLKFDNFLLGNIKTKGFTYNAKDKEPVKIIDKDAAIQIIKEWEQNFIENPCSETAGYYEAAQVIRGYV